MTLLAAAIQTLETCEQTSSRNAKLTALGLQKTNDVLREMVYYALVGQKYWITAPERYRDDSVALDDSIQDKWWADWKLILDRMTNEELRGSAGQEELEKLFVSVPGRVNRWFVRVLNRDLLCGVNLTTALYIWPNLFGDPAARQWTFPVRLAETYYSGVISDPDYKGASWAVEPKLDGFRCLAGWWDCEDCQGTGEAKQGMLGFANVIGKDTDFPIHCAACKGRGKKIWVFGRYGRAPANAEAVEMIQTHLEIVLPYDKVVDGELLADDWNLTSSLVTTKHLQKKPHLQEAMSTLRYWLWDLIPLALFQNTLSWDERPYKERRAKLENLLDHYNEQRAAMSMLLGKPEAVESIPIRTPLWVEETDPKQMRPLLQERLKLVPCYGFVNSQEEIDPLVEKALAEGHEGVMLKVANDGWWGGRSWGWLKLKPWVDVTAIIVGGQSTRGKTCDSQGGCGHKMATPQHECPICGRDIPEMLGAFVCQLQDGRQFNVGIGFKQTERIDFWERRNELRFCKIEVNIQSRQGISAVVSFPRKPRVREDLPKGWEGMNPNETGADATLESL